MSQLTDIKDIGPHAAGLLIAAGLETVQALADADLAVITRVRGFGPKRAEAVRNAARNVLAAPALVASPKAAKSVPEKTKEVVKVSKKKEKKKGKKKNDKKKSKGGGKKSKKKGGKKKNKSKKK